MSKVPIQRPLHVPIQSETTTNTAYSPIVMTKLWRPPRSINQGSPSPMETMSVQQWSYKPFKLKKIKIEIEDNCTCIIAAQCNGTDDTRRSTVPIENCTTYTSTYGPGHGTCNNLVVNTQFHKNCSTFRHKKRP